MSRDDLIYLVMLFVSIAFGALTRKISSLFVRKWVSSIFGIVVITVVSGVHVMHPLTSFFIHTSLIKVVPRSRVHLVNFYVGFLYLFFFRICGYGPEWICTATPGPTNAIQMMMTLKLMGLAFEIHDSKKEENSLDQEFHQIDPTLEDMFHYVFTHAGILTGPYFKFRTFQDLYTTKFADQTNCFKATLHRLRPVPLYVLLFLISGHIWPLEAVTDDTYFENSTLLGRIAYMTPVFFNFRMRLYTGFVLSECSCIMAGLGAYPKRSKPQPGCGPTDLVTLHEIKSSEDEITKEEIDFETIHNIDEWRVESVSTMREALRTWNMTVQYWLAANVYRRLSRKVPRAVRTLAVMAASSAWHGVYAGYYLSLGSVALVLPVEDLYDKILRRRLVERNCEKLIRVYDWIGWFVRFQWFSYLGMAFRLLHVETTLMFWRSIYFSGHLSLPILYVVGLVVVRPLVRMLLPQKPHSQ